MAVVLASLDHYIGRIVTDVIKGDEACDWSIQMEGGILIANKCEEEEYEQIPDVKGKVLLFVALSETETRMQFGHAAVDELGVPTIIDEVWVNLSPTEYTLSGLEDQTEEYYPQNPPTLEDALPADPSADRIVDGPLEGSVSPQEAETPDE